MSAASTAASGQWAQHELPLSPTHTLYGLVFIVIWSSGRGRRLRLGWGMVSECSHHSGLRAANSFAAPGKKMPSGAIMFLTLLLRKKKTSLLIVSRNTPELCSLIRHTCVTCCQFMRGHAMARTWDINTLWLSCVPQSKIKMKFSED